MKISVRGDAIRCFVERQDPGLERRECLGLAERARVAGGSEEWEKQARKSDWRENSVAKVLNVGD